MSIMQLSGPEKQPVTDETEVLREMLSWENARVLELGCGAADKTRYIASRLGVEEIVAAEVDQIQHKKNLRLDGLGNVRFESFGAEAIEAEDETFDIVLMFKSLHHVPQTLMPKAMQEIHRVLKPGGLAYFSEPVFAGAFNEIMRLFHDEEVVRAAAFRTIAAAVDEGLFALEREHFFRNRIRMTSWEQYESGILGVTHTNHRLSDETYREVKRRFLASESDEGFVFEVPNRIDLVRKSVK
ncbi:MAG: class I SAM-dependent methyltransferase [Proteobacteria bacterium]|jgi:SAM-dependent methyltransferase|nr:class I SAM-dependent methyltransferase [Pseudomonadota bacterium]MDA1300125.1 class I SAM-dependent methyltransferase [Pseudomonadota bacterium]